MVKATPIPSNKKYKAKTMYSIYNIQPHRSYVATLPENTLPTEKERCFFFSGWATVKTENHPELNSWLRPRGDLRLLSGLGVSVRQFTATAHHRSLAAPGRPTHPSSFVR